MGRRRGDVTVWDVAAGRATATLTDQFGPDQISLAFTADGYWSNPTFSSDGRWLAVDDSKGVEL